MAPLPRPCQMQLLGFTSPATHPHLYPTETQDKVSGERGLF